MMRTWWNAGAWIPAAFCLGIVMGVFAVGLVVSWVAL